MSRARVTRFAFVGVLNTVLDFLVLNLLVFVFGMPKLPANVVSSGTAMGFSYLMNHRFVFGSKSVKSRQQFIMFIAITAFGLFVLQNVIIWFFTNPFTWPAELAYDLVSLIFGDKFSERFVELNVAKGIATIATMTWNYVLYAKFVFVSPRNDEST